MVQNCNKIINKVFFFGTKLIYDFIIGQSFYIEIPYGHRSKSDIRRVLSKGQF